MKRSKIFLAMTSCFLAIAGIAATRVNHFNKTSGWFYTTVTGKSHPVQVQNIPCTRVVGSLCKIFTTLGAQVTVYTTNAFLHPLYKDNEH